MLARSRSRSNLEVTMRSPLPIAVFSSGSHQTASTLFGRMANATAAWSGKPIAFLMAFGVVLLWAITGPIFHYSDTWQLVINTGTTIVTFLMVFLIQNTQNRDTLALQVKLSELILALSKMRWTKNSRKLMRKLSESLRRRTLGTADGPVRANHCRSVRRIDTKWGSRSITAKD